MIAIFLALVVLFAWLEARRDARLIADGKVIEHAKRWKHRLLVACWLCFALIMIFVPKEAGIWAALRTFGLLLIASGALFSCAFRFLLNRRRVPKVHPCYVSPSSWYDWQFIVAAWYIHWHRTPFRHYRKNLIQDWGRLYHGDDSAVKEFGWDYIDDHIQHTHQAGRLAYIFELVVTAAMLILLAQ